MLLSLWIEPWLYDHELNWLYNFRLKLNFDSVLGFLQVKVAFCSSFEFIYLFIGADRAILVIFQDFGYIKTLGPITFAFLQ